MRKIVATILVALLIAGTFSGCGQKTPTVEELLSLGERYLTELDYEKAIVTFNKVIEIEPKNEKAYQKLIEPFSINWTVFCSQKRMKSQYFTIF